MLAWSKPRDQIAAVLGTGQLIVVNINGWSPIPRAEFLIAVYAGDRLRFLVRLLRQQARTNNAEHEYPDDRMAKSHMTPILFTHHAFNGSV